MILRMSLLILVAVGSCQHAIANQTAERTGDRIATEQIQLLEQAQNAIDGGSAEDAIDAYASLLKQNPNNQRLQYNRAVALHSAGKIQEAQAEFTRLAASLDTEIAAKARYNTGNCQFSAAMQVMMEQPTQAIELLQQSIESFRSSLRLNPNDLDARSNIELAVQWLKKLQQLKDEQQDQSSDQSQQQENESQQDEDDQQQPDQNGEQKDNEEQQQDQEGQEQNSPEEDSTAQEQRQQDGQQQGNQQQNNDGEEQQPESSGNGEGGSDEEDSRQQSGQQDEQSESQPKNQDQASNEQQTPESQDNDQPSNDQEPNAKSSQPEGDLSSDNSQQQQKLQQPVPATEGKMTKQEALKMLQAIRDRDFMRRLRIEAAEKARRLPVEKDW